MIYVGEMMACLVNSNWRWRESCHLFCNGNLDELHTFAVKLGLRREWFQKHAAMPHYDLTRAKRQQALCLGAIPADRRTEGLWIKTWRQGVMK